MDSTDIVNESHDKYGSCGINAQIVYFLSDGVDFHIYMIEATNFVHTSFELWLFYRSVFNFPIIMVLSHILDQSIGIVEGFIHWGSSCCNINSHYCVIKKIVVKRMDN